MCAYRGDALMTPNTPILSQYLRLLYPLRVVSLTLRLLYPLRKTPCTHRKRESLGSTVVLGVFKRQISSSYREPNPRPSVPLPGNYTPYDVATPNVNMSCLLIVSAGQLHLLKLWKRYLLNHLKTKPRPLYLKTQAVPRCKHFSALL